MSKNKSLSILNAMPTTNFENTTSNKLIKSQKTAPKLIKMKKMASETGKKPILK